MLAVVIFCLTYTGVALGRLPGLLIDRTGIALLGAIAMVAGGIVPFSDLAGAIDMPTIILLYSLMVVSAQLRLGGFYTWTALRCTGLLYRPRIFLLASMSASAVLSALLANDIFCLAFTPVLTASLLRAGLNPLPYLLGLAIASNIGSAATIIGNPQNMLIGQIGGLHFGPFLLWCLPPAVLSLLGGYVFICLFHQQSLTEKLPAVHRQQASDWPAFDRWQTTKGIAVTGTLVLLFFSPLPRELSAIAAAGILLCSRKMKSRHILELIDWHLITLFCALFIVIHGIEIHAIPARLMNTLMMAGVDLNNLYMLTGISTLTSNLVSNVPASMLLVKFLNPSEPVQWYTLAVSSTFAGNLILIGSIANLIVVEQAARQGITISFRDHARVGIPVTLFSLLVLAGWIWFTG